MRKTDTIAAISTPHGVGGVAMLRLSGPDALPLALKHLSVPTLAPRRATYCRFDDLDDGIATYYPHGYTGEPTVEFTSHGSLYVQQALLEAITSSGARLAEAGEFTMRAFLNRKIDLSQAEAIADLIEATTPAQHRLAVSQLRGGYAKQLAKLRQQMLDLASLMELELDFSQEDVEFADRHQLQSLVAETITLVERLLDSFRAGNALKRGIPIAIVGRPNAGKSSLLNALLGDERAIVSPVPGTTRDTIEETLTLNGLQFRFIDTAGLRHTADTVEAIGVERSRRAIEAAELVLYVHDATTPWVEPDLERNGKPMVAVISKSDLAPASSSNTPADGTPWVAVSTLQHSGLDELCRTIVATVGYTMPAEHDTLLSNARHRDALSHAAEALHQVADGLTAGLPTDLVCVDLRDAINHIGSITGDVTTDELLGNIFGRFCIGK